MTATMAVQIEGTVVWRADDCGRGDGDAWQDGSAGYWREAR